MPAVKVGEKDLEGKERKEQEQCLVKACWSKRVKGSGLGRKGKVGWAVGRVFQKLGRLRRRCKIMGRLGLNQGSNGERSCMIFWYD